MRHQFDDDGLPVGVNPKGGATDVKTRPLQSPFSNVFDFEEASGMAGTGSKPPREVVPMPWEYRRQRPLTYTQNALYDAASFWTWDAFQYAVTQEYPLATLARFLIVESSGLAERLDLDLDALDRFLLAVDAAYASPSVNPSVEIGVPRRVLPRGAAGTGGELGAGCGFVGYHNVVHACDVLQGAHAFLYLGGLTSALGDDDALALLIAAIVHDVCHPGVDNEFLRRTESEVALRYHGDAPLERHHAYAAYALMRRPATRFFNRWDAARAAKMELKVRSLVLATDMKHHHAFIERLVEFQSATKPPPTPPPTPPTEVPSDMEESADEDDEDEPPPEPEQEPGKKKQSAMAAALGIPDPDAEDEPELLCAAPGPHIAAASDASPDFLSRKEEYRMTLMTASLKCADLGHLARPYEIHRVWVEALQEEFWAQGDREREAFSGRVISNAATHDRYHDGDDEEAKLEGVEKATVSFFDLFGLPLFDAVAAAMPLACSLAAAARENRDKWDPVAVAEKAAREAREAEEAAKRAAVEAEMNAVSD
jgi:cAMP-specific phosphodiesterase 4